MHARELIELASLVAHHGPVLIRGEESISEPAVESYWIASKSRLDRWGRTLKVLSDCSKRNRVLRPAQQMSAIGVIEEILTGEVLTRVWTATTSAHDKHHGTDGLDPIARSVLISHLEARHRVLTLLIRGPGIRADEAVMLDRLRRRCERWSDMLLGYLGGLVDVDQFAIDPTRANDFSEDFAYQKHRSGGRFAWPLIVASLKDAFQNKRDQPSPNADLNAKIATSIIGCLPSGPFDTTGIFQSAWLLRLSSNASNAQGMIDYLLDTERRQLIGE